MRANLREVRAATASGVAVMAVVKADAYGHGAAQVAGVLEDAGADSFGVATVDEGLELRAAGIRHPILVLYGTDPSRVADAIGADLAVSIVDAEELEPMIEAVGAGHLVVHLEVDTGMTRLGVRPQEVGLLADRIRRAAGLELAGLFSHLGNADSAHTDFADAQVEIFRDVVATLDGAGMLPTHVHLANSVGTLTRADTHWNMVRPGVCLYGVLPGTAAGIILTPVMTLETTVWRLWEVPVGRHVGYDQTFVTQRPTRIAVLPMGYADGYGRGFSNRGEVGVRGRRVPVIGRVCMDVTMVDVSDLEDVAVGDPVVVWGNAHGVALPVDEVARACDTIPYEVFTRVGRRVPRVIR